jgi:hypothetical protein
MTQEHLTPEEATAVRKAYVEGRIDARDILSSAELEAVRKKVRLPSSRASESSADRARAKPNHAPERGKRDWDLPFRPPTDVLGRSTNEGGRSMAKPKTPAREVLLALIAESKSPLAASDAITALVAGKGLTGKYARANGSYLVSRLVRDGLVERKDDGTVKATPAGRKAAAK